MNRAERRKTKHGNRERVGEEPKDLAASNPETRCREKVDAYCHVHAATVRVEITEALLFQHEKERKEDARDKKTQLLWARISAGLILLYAFLTLLIYCANNKAADTAQKTLTSNQRRFRLSERPYVWAEPFGAGPKDVVVQKLPDGDWRFGIQYRLNNSGLTPAVNLRMIKPQMLIGPPAEVRMRAKTFEWIYPDKGSGLIAQGKFLISDTSTHGRWEVIPASQMKKVNSGELEIYVVGAIEYTDIFSPAIDPYVTTYCTMYIPIGMPLGDCDFGYTTK